MNFQKYSYKFSYVSAYEEIYDSSYGVSFVYIDEDDEIDGDVDFYPSIPPVTPAGFCKNREIGIA